MHLGTLHPKHTRKRAKRIGRGGKRGTTSGKGTKGQKSRAGASVRAGFRGGDNRIWQLFPKQRGASKKHGNKSPHHKHRFFSLHQSKPQVVNLSMLSAFPKDSITSPEILIEKKLIRTARGKVKILGTGELKHALKFSDVIVSASARAKIEKVGGSIISQ